MIKTLFLEEQKAISAVPKMQRLILFLCVGVLVDRRCDDLSVSRVALLSAPREMAPTWGDGDRDPLSPVCLIAAQHFIISARHISLRTLTSHLGSFACLRGVVYLANCYVTHLR